MYGIHVYIYSLFPQWQLYTTSQSRGVTSIWAGRAVAPPLLDHLKNALIFQIDSILINSELLS